jgi:hypothetical protein
MIKPSRLVLAFALAASLPSAVAQAQTPSSTANASEAPAHFRRGVELYEEADFTAALVEFKRAYELNPNFKVLYNIAQSNYQLQNYAAALQTFERYLAEGGTNIPEERRNEVQRELERLKTRVAKVAITVNVPGADIYVDDVLVGQSPLADPVLLSAGQRRIRASRYGRTPTSKVVEIAGGDTPRIGLDLAELPAPITAPPPAAPRRETSAAPFVGWTLTGALAVTAGVAGIMALSSADDLSKMRDEPGRSRQDLDDAQSKVKTLALVTDIFAGAAVVAGGISLYLTLSQPSKKEGRAGTTVRLAAKPGGASLTGTF